MKIHLLSDLHLEVCPYEIRKVEAEVLVLAGDIANSKDGIIWASQYRKQYKKIIYIAGNHEYYHQNLSQTSLEIKKLAKELGIDFLDNDICVLDDTVFIGSTLWTDFRLYGDSLDRIGFFMNRAKNGLMDFSCIRYAHIYLQPSHTATFSINAQNFIKEKLSEYKNFKKVVITHHAPSVRSVHEKYYGNVLNPCFANDLDSLVEMSDYWLHGHVHDSFKYKVGNATVVANPRGYSNGEDVENKMFKHDYILNI